MVEHFVEQWTAFCGVYSGFALFANYPFRGLQTTMGLTLLGRLHPLIWYFLRISLFFLAAY